MFLRKITSHCQASSSKGMDDLALVTNSEVPETILHFWTRLIESYVIGTVTVSLGGLGLAVASLVMLKRRRDRRLVMCKINKDLSGKYVVITGSSSGLGRETALELVRRRATVIMACRNLKKAALAGDYIKKNLNTDLKSSDSSATSALQNPGLENLKVMELQLNSIASIQKFVNELKSVVPRVDILINNAGIMFYPFCTSKDGFEMHFAVNHMGHFVLTNLLRQQLEKSPEARVINISSGYYKKVGFVERDWSYMNSLTQDQSQISIKVPHRNPLVLYGLSKLANCLHAMELPNRFEGNVKSCAIRPGFIRGTDLGRNFARYYTARLFHSSLANCRLFRWLASPFVWFFSVTIQQGIQTILYCCMTDDLKSGALYYNCAIEEYVPELVNDRDARQFWDLCAHWERQLLKEKAQF